MDQQMNQQSPAHPWNPALDYDVETAVQRALNRTGGGWPLHVQVVLPLRALVAMAALGNGATCWLFCFRTRRGPYLAYILHLQTASAWAARPWSSWRRSSSWVPS